MHAPAPTFTLKTALGPATLYLHDADRGLVAAEPLTVNRIAYEVRFYFRRDSRGRLWYDALHAYRVADRGAMTDNARHKLIDAVHSALTAFEHAHPEAFALAARYDVERRAQELDDEAARHERAAAAMRDQAAALRATRPIAA